MIRLLLLSVAFSIAISHPATAENMSGTFSSGASHSGRPGVNLHFGESRTGMMTFRLTESEAAAIPADGRFTPRTITLGDAAWIGTGLEGQTQKGPVRLEVNETWSTSTELRGRARSPIRAAAPASEPRDRSTRTVPPPAVDHHQHLLSPTEAASMSTPIAPPIEVPAAVARLLQSRAALTAEPDALAELFTEDVVFLGSGNPGGWKRNREDVASFIALSFSRGYHLTPVSFTEYGDTAHVAGYYSRGEGATLRHPGQFSMVLRKAPGDGWQIAAEIPVFPGPAKVPPIDAATLIAMLDEAGIRKSIVLSNAYFYDGIVVHEGDVYAKVRAENDWTAQQVRQFPERLLAFCSFNPLAAHALAELERCAGSNAFSGLKLHFGNSGVDLTNSAHVRQVRQVFKAANDVGWPITVHLAASPAYSAVHAETFIADVLSAAPDVPVVVAHLWGGAGYVDPALAVYADAITAGRAEVSRLYFDLAQVSMVEARSEENLKQITERMRQIGMGRMLYASDGAFGPGMPAARVWEHFLSTMPLTEEEFRAISTNVLEIEGLSATTRGARRPSVSLAGSAERASAVR